jgi:hypothetical protein
VLYFILLLASGTLFSSGYYRQAANVGTGPLLKKNGRLGGRRQTPPAPADAYLQFAPTGSRVCR